jgi:endoglucanase
MVRSKRISPITLTCMSMLVLISLFLLISASHTYSASAAVLSPPTTMRVANHIATSYLPLGNFHLRGIDGPYHTQGNLILGADGQPYLFHGIARDDLEYLCTSDGHYTQQELAYMGWGKNSAHATYWGGNIVRLPLSENFWLYGSTAQSCSPTQYQTMLKSVVDILTSLNLNVMLDLQWSNAGGQSQGAGDAWAMPDQDSVTFWHHVASAYKNYQNVLFELFNEPHMYPNSWSCWRNGCQIVKDNSGPGGHDHGRYSYQSVGMQTLLDTVRQSGANNLAIVGGTDWGFDLSQVPTYHLSGANVVYDTHPYPYGGKQPSDWESAFGKVSATYPVISTESGEYDCKTTFVSQLLDYFDAHDIGWISWAWVPPVGDVCSYPRMVVDLNGFPTAYTGLYIYQYLHTYMALLAGEEIPSKIK